MSRRLLQVLPALLVLFALAAQAQRYTKVVVFGDSLSDTGNDSIVFAKTYPGLAPFPSPILGNTYYGLYALGRFTDDLFTYPSAQRYFGVWVEQLAGSLPSHPLVLPSQLGGTNYAYGYANTLDGTTPLNFTGTPFTITVSNVGKQIDQYLATHPRIDDHTLFVVWGGANNLTEALLDDNPPLVKVGEVESGAVEQVGNVQRLIQAGATQFLIPNLPDLGLVPRINVLPLPEQEFVTELSMAYNETLDAYVSLLPTVGPFGQITIHKFDVFGLLHQIVLSPGSYGLLNATQSSQSEPVNPDTYLFWDDLHPTTRGHFLLGEGALEAIEPPGCVIVAPSGQYFGSAAPGCR